MSDEHPFTLTAIGALLAEPDDPVNWLVEEMIPAGAVVVMAAKPKVGKSTAARHLALAVARGDAWLGRPCTAGSVWYLAFEGRRRDVKQHFRQMGATTDDALHVFVGQAPRNVVLAVQKLATQERPALIIIDTMQRFIKAKSNDDYAEMTLLLDTVIELARQSGATIFLLTHASKADRASIDAILGSTAIAGSADSIILLTRSARYRTIATVQRVGTDLDETVLLLDEATGRVRLGGSRHLADVAHVRHALRSALGSGPLTSSALLDAVEARRQLKLEGLRDLLQAGSIIRSGRGTKVDPFVYTAADEVDASSPEPAVPGAPGMPEQVSERLPGMESGMWGIGGNSDSSSPVPLKRWEPESSSSSSGLFAKDSSTDSSSRVPGVPGVPEKTPEPVSGAAADLEVQRLKALLRDPAASAETKAAARSALGRLGGW